jgi:excisionase family DNA binding protein
MRGQMSLAIGGDPRPVNGRSHEDPADRFQRTLVSSEGPPVTSKEVQPAARTEMFDKQNLARYFRVSVDTIERLVKAGELPAVRIGNQVRFTLEDVDGFIERHRTKERTA